MCITTGSAFVSDTAVYGYVPAPDTDGVQRHIVGYQNQATSKSGPNCMILNYAGFDLRLVDGPQHTRHMMERLTHGLFSVDDDYADTYLDGSYDVAVEEYGAYTVLVSQSPGAILETLQDDAVPDSRRPEITPRLRAMADFLKSSYPHDTFVLACFDHHVKPEHPIVVSYVPRQPEFITVPGLDGHDGKVPEVGGAVYRNFKLVFGIHGVDLSPVRYDADVIDHSWAPQSVLGFIDNRTEAPNGNYSLPIEAIRNYLGTDPDEVDFEDFPNEYDTPGLGLLSHLELGNL